MADFRLHYYSIYLIDKKTIIGNLVPRLFHLEEERPGRSWSRGSQILGAKLKLYLERGGRGVRLLRLENYNLGVIVSDDKI